MRKTLTLLIVLYLMPLLVSGAVIKGSVYDLSLEKINGAVIDVDSSPKQQIISKDGSYNFTLQQGTYTITAKQLKNGKLIANSSEKIAVNQEGEFNLDIILLPVFEEIGAGDIDLSPKDFEQQDEIPIFTIIGFILVGIIFLIIFVKLRQIRKEKPKEVVREIVREIPKIEVVKEVIKEVKTGKLPQDLEKAIEIIKSQGGRTTQKEIRKEMNLSEAKISLMMDDLENRGLIKKIKRGRGNVIILS